MTDGTRVVSPLRQFVAIVRSMIEVTLDPKEATMSKAFAARNTRKVTRGWLVTPVVLLLFAAAMLTAVAIIPATSRAATNVDSSVTSSPPAPAAVTNVVDGCTQVMVASNVDCNPEFAAVPATAFEPDYTRYGCAGGSQPQAPWCESP